MSSRSHRFEAGNTPLSEFHGGTAAAAKAAIKAARTEALLKAVAKAKAKPSSRVRPKARPLPVHPPKAVSKWACRPSGNRRQPRQTAKNVGLCRLDMQDSATRRMILIEAQMGFCALCGMPLSEGNRISPTDRPSIDHVVPLSMDGVNAFNLVAAHNQCNANKANDAPTGCEVVWLIVVNARMRALPDEMQRVFYR